MLPILALAAALVTPATANPHNLDCGNILMPPPGEYDVAPGMFDRDPIIRLMDFWSVDPFCRQHGASERGHYEACHFGITDVIPSGPEVTHDRQVCYFIHEEAHRHGWGGDHPGAIYWRGK